MQFFTSGSPVNECKSTSNHISFRQNLVLKVFAKLLPNLNDSKNPGSLNCFRALTSKAREISNKVCEVEFSHNFEDFFSGK